MKSFKQFVSESPEEPRGGDERKFKQRHVDATDHIDYPIKGQEHVFKGTEKAPSRLADIDNEVDMYDDQYVDDGDEGEVEKPGESEEDESEEHEGVETRKKETQWQRNDMVGEETLIEAIRPGSVKLKDGCVKKITKEDANAINVLFNKLSTVNRAKMESHMTSSEKGFSDILEFAKNI